MKHVRRAVSSVLVVAAAIGLGAYLYFFDSAHVNDAERSQREVNVFPAWRRDALRTIELDVEGEKLVFERVADGGDRAFEMTTPEGVVSDAAAIDELLGKLEHASIVRKLDADPPGNAPRVKGTLTMGDLVMRFELGGDAPSPEGAAYFRFVGDGKNPHPFVVSREFATQLRKRSDAYRDKTIVPYLSLVLRELSITGPTTNVHLVRSADDPDAPFRFAEGGPQASRERLDRIWLAISELRVASYVDQETATRALGTPGLTLVMVPKKAAKPKAVIEIGGPCPNGPGRLAIRREPDPLAACIPSDAVERLSGIKHDDLADTHAALARADEVEELTLERTNAAGGKVPKLELARKEQGFHQRAPIDRDLTKEESETAEKIVQAIAKVEGQIIPPPAAFEPTLRATFKVRGGAHVVLLAPSGEQWIVRRETDRTTLSISGLDGHRFVPRAIPPSPNVFQVVDPEKADAIHVACGWDQVLTKSEAGWTVRVAGESYPADTARIAEWLTALKKTKLDEIFEGAVGAEKPCSLSVTQSGKTEAFTQVGDSAANLVARAHVATYGVSPAFLTELHVLRIRRAIFPDASDVVTEIRINSRKGETTRLGPNDGAKFDDMKHNLLALVGDAVALKADPEHGFGKDEDRITVRWVADGGAQESVLHLGKRAEKTYFARVDGRGVIYTVATSNLPFLVIP